MVIPVLVTKLYIPAARPTLVRRPHLIERLNDSHHQGLTLICAPAGFGKTTLLSEWIEGIDTPAAWLSLDEGDNDPTRFLTYLIAALQTVSPSLGQGLLRSLQSSEPPTEAVLVALLNEISQAPRALVLVLDDYHAIDASDVDWALTFLVEHLPPQLHLVISTRQDPNLPLARLRARGSLVELRAADLRFTHSEAAEYLNSVMGLSLSEADVASLEGHTEGWIAGLQLAALSMRGRDDAATFIAGFAGDHRYITDYLVGEVLGRQTDDVRSFLLHTAVLDRMSGPLCEAVTGQNNCGARLETLERGNFFVVPLDDKRQWYRYHHLFAEVLRAYLKEEQPGTVLALHRRASEWYEHNGSPSDAVRHSLAAQDFENAATLVERAAPMLLQMRQEATLLGWLRALPDDVFDNRPVLSATFAGTLLASGELDGVEARLRDAERWLDTTPETGGRARTSSGSMIVVNEEEFPRLPGQIALWRAGIAQLRGQSDDTVMFARRALDLVREDDHLVRGGAAALVGLAAWAKGDLDTTYEMYVECIDRMHKVDRFSDVVGCSITLADICIAQGRLHDAMGIYERGLQLATQYGEPPLRGAADMYVGMSELHREHGDLDAASRELERGRALGETVGLPQNPYRWRVAAARIREAEGDLDGAVAMLDEAEPVFTSDFSPNVRPIPAMRARMWVAQGKLREAHGWANERGLAPQDELSYLREFEHLTLARVLLAAYDSDHSDDVVLDAIRLLERLLQAAQQGGRTGTAIEILVQQALAHQARGDVSAALVPLERALTLAEPEGYMRTFVGEGVPMEALLHAAARRGIARGYVGQLLAGASKTAPARQALIEPLSGRELEVLRLLGTELGGPGIARELVVSLNTVRTHTKNIYAKLGVNSRREAVRRAEQLGLLRTRNA
jgi:LuxR family maltose regulon positive regulatory protein